MRARGGDDAVRAILGSLPPRHRDVLSGILLPIGWYDFEINERLDAAIASYFGSGMSIYHELGAASALDALATTHKNFVRDRDPHGLLERVAQIHRLYKDTGYMTYDRVDDTTAVLRTIGCDSFSAADCLTNLGWHEKAIELCAGFRVRVNETRCRARGEPLCEYVCKWWPRPSEAPPPPSSSRPLSSRPRR